MPRCPGNLVDNRLSCDSAVYMNARKLLIAFEFCQFMVALIYSAPDSFCWRELLSALHRRSCCSLHAYRDSQCRWPVLHLLCFPFPCGYIAPYPPMLLCFFTECRYCRQAGHSVAFEIALLVTRLNVALSQPASLPMGKNFQQGFRPTPLEDVGHVRTYCCCVRKAFGCLLVCLRR